MSFHLSCNFCIHRYFNPSKVSMECVLEKPKFPEIGEKCKQFTKNPDKKIYF